MHPGEGLSSIPGATQSVQFELMHSVSYHTALYEQGFKWSPLPGVDRPMRGKIGSKLGHVLGIFIAIGVKTGTPLH